MQARYALCVEHRVLVCHLRRPRAVVKLRENLIILPRLTHTVELVDIHFSPVEVFETLRHFRITADKLHGQYCLRNLSNGYRPFQRYGRGIQPRGVTLAHVWEFGNFGAVRRAEYLDILRAAGEGQVDVERVVALLFEKRVGANDGNLLPGFYHGFAAGAVVGLNY